MMHYSCDTSSVIKVVLDNEYNKEIFYIDKDSIRNGLYIEFEPNGVDTISIVNYVSGEMDGIRRTYDEEGNLSTVETYNKGVLNGKELTFHPNGKIHTKGNFTNGNLDSLFYVYYETGELKEKVTMVDFTENGPFEEYYKNGQIHWAGTFIDGPNEVGLLTEYSEQGEVIKKMECGIYLGEYICQTVWRKGEGDVALKLKYDE
jgi:antitoxin component YwqK of YwqJK toxin-antitoxin module